jgi:hypothetical protein
MCTGYNTNRVSSSTIYCTRYTWQQLSHMQCVQYIERARGGRVKSYKVTALHCTLTSNLHERANLHTCKSAHVQTYTRRVYFLLIGNHFILLRYQPFIIIHNAYYYSSQRWKNFRRYSNARARGPRTMRSPHNVNSLNLDNRKIAFD